MEDQMTGYMVIPGEKDSGWDIPILFVDSANMLLGLSNFLSQVYGIELGENPIVKRVRITVLE